MASKVLRLNSRVPANWTAALHQDGFDAQRPRRSVASRSSSPAASVKNTEPAKKTTPSAPAPTSWTKPGNGPMKKHAEPIAKPIAIQRSQTTPVDWPRGDGQRVADHAPRRYAAAGGTRRIIPRG